MYVSSLADESELMVFVFSIKEAVRSSPGYRRTGLRVSEKYWEGVKALRDNGETMLPEKWGWVVWIFSKHLENE